MLSTVGGLAGVLTALTIELLATLAVSGFAPVPPAWAMLSGVLASTGVGVVAGYWPAYLAASLGSRRGAQARIAASRTSAKDLLLRQGGPAAEFSEAQIAYALRTKV